MNKLVGIIIIVVAMAAAAWFATPRYQLVATNMFNVGGVYKLDTRSGQLWLCSPVAINVDKTNIVPGNGCYPINDHTGPVATGDGTQI